MNKGYIDLASISGVAGALTYDHFDNWPEWTLQSIVEVTSALCNDHNLQVAPGPGRVTAAEGLNEKIILPLSAGGLVFSGEISALRQLEAREKTRLWIKRNSDKVAGIFHDEVLANKNLEPWLERAISHFWVDHSRALGGLFNSEFIEELSPILKCDPSDLRAVWQKSCDLKQVEAWAKGQPDSSDFKLAKDAYVLAVVLRGRFHDHIAEESHLAIMHHPLRRNSILPTRKEVHVYTPTNAEVFLTSVLLTSAMVEKRIESRIALWVENLLKARELVRTQAIDLSHKNSSTIARDHVVSVLKRYQFRTHSRAMALGLDNLSSIVMSAFSFGLCQWFGIPSEAGWLVGPVIARVTKRKTDRSIGERVASKVVGTEHHFGELADALPGRLVGKWNA